MRTNIEIDDALLAEAQALAGTRTKKATVEFALSELIRRRTADPSSTGPRAGKA